MAFNVTLEMKGSEAHLTLSGELDAASAGAMKESVEKAAGNSAVKLVMHMQDLSFMASAGLRVLIFAKQKMGVHVDIYVIGSRGPVLGTLEMTGFHHSVHIQDSFADV
jgi:anti-anti-sigma factor